MKMVKENLLRGKTLVLTTDKDKVFTGVCEADLVLDYGVYSTAGVQASFIPVRIDGCKVIHVSVAKLVTIEVV